MVNLKFLQGYPPHFLLALRLVELDDSFPLHSINIGPGSANTSLFCSSARSAVIRDPLLVFASTTKTPLLIPLIIRFLFGKYHFSAHNEADTLSITIYNLSTCHTNLYSPLDTYKIIRVLILQWSGNAALL